MIDFDFRPQDYGIPVDQAELVAALHYPESQWGEKIELFANRVLGGYFFEAIDFYGNEISLTPGFSDIPLSQKEMIAMIESMQPENGSYSGNLSLTLLGIPEVTSNHYPDLDGFFAAKRKRLGLE